MVSTGPWQGWPFKPATFTCCEWLKYAKSGRLCIRTHCIGLAFVLSYFCVCGSYPSASYILCISGDSVLTVLWQFIHTFNDGIDAFFDLYAPEWQYWHLICIAPACRSCGNLIGCTGWYPVCTLVFHMPIHVQLAPAIDTHINTKNTNFLFLSNFFAVAKRSTATVST